MTSRRFFRGPCTPRAIHAPSQVFITFVGLPAAYATALRMWLLDTWAIDIISVSSATEEPYAILSHVWDNLLGEDTFQVIAEHSKPITTWRD